MDERGGGNKFKLWYFYDVVRTEKQFTFTVLLLSVKSFNCNKKYKLKYLNCGQKNDDFHMSKNTF